MSNVSTSPSASPPTSDAGRVTPAPVTPGRTGHQQTPSQREPQPQTTTLAPPPDTAVTLAPTLAGFSEGESVAITVLGRDAEGHQEARRRVDGTAIYVQPFRGRWLAIWDRAGADIAPEIFER